MNYDRRNGRVVRKRPYGNGPVISRSECGSFRSDGDADMRVLRNRAEDAVRYFNSPTRGEECCPFSTIVNGKLMDVDDAHNGNIIKRKLCAGGGVYTDEIVLSYRDIHNDKLRGYGGYGAINAVVKDVSIKNGYLVISGYDVREDSCCSYSYKIQDQPDGRSSVRKTTPKKDNDTPKRTLDDWDGVPKKPVRRTETPKEPKKASKPSPTKAKPSKPVETSKKTSTKKTDKPKKGDHQYEVRVGGTVKASFSSKSKADRMRKELKSQGIDAKVVGVYC